MAGSNNVCDKTCVICAVAFTVNRRQGNKRCCSEPCDRERKKRSMARHNERRRAKLRANGDHMERPCQICGAVFAVPICTGSTGRMYCSKPCVAEAHRRARLEREIKAPSCSTPECEGTVTRVGPQLCERCYARIRRWRKVTRRFRYRFTTREGYVKVFAPDHPMGDTQGYAFEHRIVVHDACGSVCPPCFWCGALLEWLTAVVDHLNEVKHDNRPENLAVSCNRCNRMRGAIIPFLRTLTDEARERFVDVVRQQRAPVPAAPAPAVEWRESVTPPALVARRKRQLHLARMADEIARLRRTRRGPRDGSGAALTLPLKGIR